MGARFVKSPYGVTKTSENRPDSLSDGESKQERYERKHTGSFPELRRAVLERDGFRCVECGMSDEEHKKADTGTNGGLHIHHVKPVSEFDDPEDAHTLDNLKSLCEGCHLKIHGWR